MRLPASRGGSCAGSACGWRGGGLAVADSPLISAVICTYNRADLLAGAIESLLEQTLNPAHREIIVVDNASTDGTRAVVEQFAPDGVRYVLETRQGLGYARNRGWQEARGEFVAYIDDDARAPGTAGAGARPVANSHLTLLRGRCHPAFLHAA